MGSRFSCDPSVWLWLASRAERVGLTASRMWRSGRFTSTARQFVAIYPHSPGRFVPWHHPIVSFRQTGQPARIGEFNPSVNRLNMATLVHPAQAAHLSRL